MCFYYLFLTYKEVTETLEEIEAATYPRSHNETLLAHLDFRPDWNSLIPSEFQSQQDKMRIIFALLPLAAFRDQLSYQVKKYSQLESIGL